MSLLSKLNRFPPKLCRLVARKKRGRELFTEGEIAKRAGMSAKHVRELSRLNEWPTGIGVGAIDRFAAACGVDLTSVWRHVEYLKRRKKIAWRGKETVVMKLLSR